MSEDANDGLMNEHYKHTGVLRGVGKGKLGAGRRVGIQVEEEN